MDAERKVPANETDSKNENDDVDREILKKDKSPEKPPRKHVKGKVRLGLVSALTRTKKKKETTEIAPVSVEQTNEIATEEFSHTSQTDQPAADETEYAPKLEVEMENPKVKDEIPIIQISKEIDPQQNNENDSTVSMQEDQVEDNNEDDGEDQIKKEGSRPGPHDGFSRVMNGLFGTSCPMGCMRGSPTDSDNEDEFFDAKIEAEEENKEVKEHEFVNANDSTVGLKTQNEEFEIIGSKETLETFDEIFDKEDTSSQQSESMLVTWRGIAVAYEWFISLFRSKDGNNEIEFEDTQEATEVLEDVPLEVGEDEKVESIRDDCEKPIEEDLESTPKTPLPAQEEEPEVNNDTETEIEDVIDIDESIIQDEIIIVQKAVDVEPVEVDKKTARQFKRQVHSCTRESIKMEDLSNVNGLKTRDYTVVPTVRRVDKIIYTPNNIYSEPETEYITSDSEGEILNDSPKLKRKGKGLKRIRHVLVVGGEGYGKTTLLQRYGDMALGRLLTVQENYAGKIKRWHPFARKDFFKLVHYINLSDLPTEGLYTPSELFVEFSVPGVGNDKAKVGYQWMIDYKKPLLFIIDDVDRITFGTNYEKIDYHDRTTPACILYNLFCGSLFPDAFILSSSTISNTDAISSSVRPDRTYAIAVLEEQNIKKVAKIFSSNNMSVWKTLNEKFPNLLAMCNVPLVLLYSSVALRDHDILPDTIVGVMSQFIRHTVCRKESWDVETIELLAKLKKLAHHTSSKKITVLKDEDFARFELSLASVQELAIFHPRKAKIHHNGEQTENCFTTGFTHKTIQDFLCALSLCEMTTDKFEKFARRKMNNNANFFIRRQLCGILFDEKNSQVLQNIVEVQEADGKKSIMKSALLTMAQSDDSGKNKMELYTTLNECGNGVGDMLKDNLRIVSVTGETLTPIDIRALASIIDLSSELDVLRLVDCELNDGSIKSVLDNLITSDIKIKELDIRENPRIKYNGRSLRDLCSHCKVESLNLSGCELDREKLSRILVSFKNFEFNELNVGDNQKLAEMGMQILGEIIRKSGVKSLGLKNSALTEKMIRRLKRALKETQLECLNISGNRNLGVETASSLGEIVLRCGVQFLDASDCNLSNKEIRNFQASLQTSKMKILDLSLPILTTVFGLNVIAVSRLIPHVSEELRLVNWDINDNNLKTFKETVNMMATPELRIIYGFDGRNLLTPENVEVEE